MRIVKFKNNTYGVCRGFWVFKQYLSSYTDQWNSRLPNKSRLAEYQEYDSLDRATERIQQYNQDNSIDYGETVARN